MIYYANDRYNATLTATYTVGDTTLEVDRVPANTPTIVVVNLGTPSETIFEVTDKSANTLTGVRRLRGANVNLPIGSTVTCVNNEEFINQVANFSKFNVEHKDTGEHNNINAETLTLKEQSSQTNPPSEKYKLYVKSSDKKLYKLNPDGTEEKIGEIPDPLSVSTLKTDNIEEKTSGNKVNFLSDVKLKDLAIYDSQYNSILINRHNARIPFRFFDAISLFPSNSNFRILVDCSLSPSDLSNNNFDVNLYNTNYIIGHRFLYKVFLFNGSNSYISLNQSVTNFNTSNGLTIFVVVRYDSLSQSWSRVFDLGNGSSSNNIYLAHESTGDYLRYATFNNNVESNIKINGFWVVDNVYTIGIRHSAGTPGSMTTTELHYIKKSSSGSISSGYTTNNLYLPYGINRTNSWLGRSNWADGYFQGVISFFAVVDKDIGQDALVKFLTYLRQVYY